MALMMLLQALPASAVVGYDSKYVSESDFVAIVPGEQKQFVVIFRNTGTSGWQKGAASQVDLAQCCPYNSSTPNAAWNPGTWTSSQSYATHSADFVGPGQDAFFAYGIRAPTNATAGTYRFAGDLALAATRDMIRPEGYYQEATITSTTTPTKLEVSPKYQSKVVGTTASVTATVTADAPTGSTTRPPVAGVNMTFAVACTTIGAGCLNPTFTQTAVTDATGKATLNYTRSNTGTDNVDAYVTGLPNVRDRANVDWGIAAAIAVTPDDAVTLANDKCRTYTVTQKNPADGTASANTLYGNFTENYSTASNADGGATIAAANVDNATSVNLGNAASFNVDVCGAALSTKTVSLVVYDKTTTNTNVNIIEQGNRSDQGGSITFVAPTPTITISPTDGASLSVGRPCDGVNAAGCPQAAQRVFTVTAKDQFGNAWTGKPLRLGFIETTDSLAATDTKAYLAWLDRDATPCTDASTGADAAPCTTMTQDGLAGQPQAYTAPNGTNATGTLTFGVSNFKKDTGTAVVWYDKNANLTRETDEAQGSGGSTTWATAVVSKASLTSSKTNGSSAAGEDATNTGSRGERTYSFTFKDQTGNTFGPPAAATVTFSVSNTSSSGNVYINDCLNSAGTAGTIAGSPVAPGGAPATCTATIALDSTASAKVEVDKSAAGTATISATGTYTDPATATTISFSAGPSTQTWITVDGDEVTIGAAGSVTGIVTAFSTADNWYIIDVLGTKYFINYDDEGAGAGNSDQFFVDGQGPSVGSAAISAFEAAISANDQIAFTSGASNSNAANSTDVDVHKLTNK